MSVRVQVLHEGRALCFNIPPLARGLLERLGRARGVGNPASDVIDVKSVNIVGEDLGEQVSRIGVTRDVPHDHAPSAAQLPHLEEFAVDVARILRERRRARGLLCELRLEVQM